MARRERGPRKPNAVKDAEARAALEPLGEGERPPWVTYAAYFSLFLAVGNVVALIAGAEITGDEDSATQGTVFTTILLAAMTYGMFRARYWAVLGFQAMVVLQLIVFCLLIVYVREWWQVPLILGYIALLGTFFWKLIKSMARIQMPERP